MEKEMKRQLGESLPMEAGKHRGEADWGVGGVNQRKGEGKKEQKPPLPGVQKNRFTRGLIKNTPPR